MSDSHAVEPWAVKPSSKIDSNINYIQTSQNGLIASTWRDVGGENARRIAACVNFCAGIDIKHLDTDKDSMSRIFHENDLMQDLISKVLEFIPDDIEFTEENKITYLLAKEALDKYTAVVGMDRGVDNA